MRVEDVLSHAPRVLSQAQREAYFADGYLLLEGLISAETVARLNQITAEFVEKSRTWSKSDALFDLAPTHTARRPRVRRLKEPDEIHPEYWAFATGPIADVAADLIGPDVAFHHSKLNFKWHDGGDEVRWHQDIQFYPHTNYSPLTIGLYLTDTREADGALAVLPGSHRGKLYDLYRADGNWRGSLGDSDASSLDVARKVVLEGKAGALTVHNCRTVHGSPPSKHDRGRPLLLNAYNAADAFPFTPHPKPSVHAREIVRGKAARMAHLEGGQCPVPPDWSKGYTSIFAAQAGEGGYN